MNIVTFNNLNLRTNDNKFSQGDLIDKIKKMTASKGQDNETARSVINSFVTNGIIEIYNKLGYYEWVQMINQMIDHEIAEKEEYNGYIWHG